MKTRCHKKKPQTKVAARERERISSLSRKHRVGGGAGSIRLFLWRNIIGPDLDTLADPAQLRGLQVPVLLEGEGGRAPAHRARGLRVECLGALGHVAHSRGPQQRAELLSPQSSWRRRRRRGWNAGTGAGAGAAATAPSRGWRRRAGEMSRRPLPHGVAERHLELTAAGAAGLVQRALGAGQLLKLGKREKLVFEGETSKEQGEITVWRGARRRKKFRRKAWTSRGEKVTQRR